MSSKLKAILYVPLASLFLLFGIAPPPSAHAQSMTMSHGAGVPSSPCAGPCGIAPGLLKEKQETPPANEQEDEPMPAHSVAYHGEFDPFAEPKKLPRTSTHDETILRPPDLVTLYANFRF